MHCFQDMRHLFSSFNLPGVGVPLNSNANMCWCVCVCRSVGDKAGSVFLPRFVPSR